MAAEQRVFFRDVKPYEIPDDLSTLQGPTGGEVVLSHSVLWAPEAAGSISTAGTARLGLPCGVIRGDFMFRIPTLRWADTYGPRTWTYDFRWANPALGMAFHCLELLFAWDLLGAQGSRRSRAPTRRRSSPTRCTLLGCGSSRPAIPAGRPGTATTRTSSPGSRPTRTRRAAWWMLPCSGTALQERAQLLWSGNRVTLVVRAPERLCAWATDAPTARGALRTASQVS